MYGGDFKRKPGSVISKWAPRFLDVAFPPHFPSIKVISFPEKCIFVLNISLGTLFVWCQLKCKGCRECFGILNGIFCILNVWQINFFLFVVSFVALLKH